MTIHLHRHDLPAGLDLGPVVAIDTETMGLDPRRDRLCLVQMSSGDGDAHLVQIAQGQRDAPNLVRMLADPATLKLFHFGRFDIAALENAFGVVTAPVWCTKIASKMVRTFTDRHGLKYLLADLVGVDISKQLGRAAGIRGIRRAASARAQGRAGTAAGARGADGTRAGVFRFPADPRASGPAGLGR